MRFIFYYFSLFYIHLIYIYQRMMMIVLMIPRSRFFSSVLRFWNNFSDFNRGDVVPSRYFCVSILIRRHRDRHLSLKRDEARASSCVQNGALDEEERMAAVLTMIFVLPSFRRKVTRDKRSRCGLF